MTQLIGNPNNMPVLKATSSFSGFGLVDGDPYGSAVPDYGTTNVFYRQVRILYSVYNSVREVSGASICTLLILLPKWIKQYGVAYKQT